MIEDANNRQCHCPVCSVMNRARNSEPAQHLRNARRELLLAGKSMLEICIKRLEEKNERAQCVNQARKVEIKG